MSVQATNEGPHDSPTINGHALTRGRGGEDLREWQVPQVVEQLQHRHELGRFLIAPAASLDRLVIPDIGGAQDPQAPVDDLGVAPHLVPRDGVSMHPGPVKVADLLTQLAVVGLGEPLRRKLFTYPTQQCAKRGRSTR